MKLSKNWTTVTPLSKLIALGLFISLPFLGFYLGYNAHKIPPVVQTEVDSANNNSPEVAVSNFYQWYITCLDNHFKNPMGKSPSQNCSYQSSQYVSSKLTQNVSGNIGDPILCAQNTPASFKVDKSSISGVDAQVIVRTYYTSGGDKPLKVILEKDENSWKISDIQCSGK